MNLITKEYCDYAISESIFQHETVEQIRLFKKQSRIIIDTKEELPTPSKEYNKEDIHYYIKDTQKTMRCKLLGENYVWVEFGGEGGGQVSHIGQIIMSSTLDTEEKVIALYGGESWAKIEGQFLLGASSTYPVNTTGGETTHKLTVNEMPSHNHKHRQFVFNGGSIGGTHYGLQHYTTNGSAHDRDGAGSSGEVLFGNFSTGGNGAHNNMPPYKAVYIWERTA